MKVFESKNLYNVTGKVLPLREMKLMRELDGYSLNPRKMERIVKKAEQYLTTDIPLLPASLYREYVTIGNRSNYEGLFFRRREMAFHLALAEHYEGKGRFSEKLMDVVWAIMEESTWIIPAHIYNSAYGARYTLGPVYGNNYNHGLALFSASTGALLTAVYMLAKDSLDKITPIICEKLKYTVLDRLEKPFLENVFQWMGELGGRVNNWNPWIISNVLFAVGVLEDDDYKRERVVELSVKRLDHFVNTYHPDGGCDEGANYWTVAGASLFDSLELLDDMTGGEVTVFDSELIKNIGEYIFKVNINDTTIVNFADCPPRSLPSASLLIRFGEKCGSPFLVSFGKKLMKHGDGAVSIGQPYRTLRSLVTPDVDAEECPMPTVSYLPDLKLMTARESSDSAVGTFLAVKGGHNSESHNHNDVGNFIVYKNGKPVIIDTGVGTYTKQTFSSDRYKLWFMQSGYHNLPSFGGVDQKNGQAFRSKNELHLAEEKSLSLELCEAYPSEAGVISFLRTARLDGGVATVTDKYLLDSEKEIDMHLMLPCKPEIEDAGVIRLGEGMKLYYPAELLAASVEEFEPVGMDTKSSWGCELLYRIHLTATAKELEYTLTFK